MSREKKGPSPEKGAPEGYGAASRLFHRIALSGRMTPEMFFDIEKAVHGDGLVDAQSTQHVFVSGLARSGTTLLMRMLHDSNEFASLTYRDMPLVMAPNFWAGMSQGSQKSMERSERAHGDGLEVDFDSPEALEEVFWRVFCGDQYIGAGELRPMNADADVIDDFRTYVALILKRYGAQRYLSKNNNSILRISSLIRAFPNAAVLIPFRDPVSQARSLLNQHQRFTEIHATDKFSKNYMSWLAHHEFGGDHRRFNFGIQSSSVRSDPFSLGYWLDVWIEAYSFLLAEADALGAQVIFFSYERLVEDPEAIRTQLFSRLNLSPGAAPLEVRKNAPNGVDDQTLDRLDEAYAIYDQLTALSLSAD